MPLTVKRHRRTKCIKHSNKKRIRQKHSKLPTIPSTVVRSTWQDGKSARINLKAMGLSHDSNLAVKNSKTALKKQNAPHLEVCVQLEKEAKAFRKGTFKFPAAQAKYYSYLIQKYGDNYKEMAKDVKNVYQDTWKRIRSKIQQFKKIQHYSNVLLRSGST